MRLVLLPGTDGTARLFARFVDELPEHLAATTVPFPTDRHLSYAELEQILLPFCPSDEPFVLVAESFSTPLAVQYAATAPANLRGLVLCAGFVSSPVRGWRRMMVRFLAPLLVRLPLPGFAMKLLLVGRKAPDHLVAALRAAISLVQPQVLSARLRTVLACDMRLALQQISIPILYIQAKNDRLIGSHCAGDVRRCNSNVDVVSVEGPHLIVQREPRKIAEIVCAYVRQLGVH